MSHAPFFPAWRSRFNRRPSARLSASVAGLRRCILDKLEERFDALLSGLPELSAASASRRERPYSVRRTWWCFLWQMLQCNTSCREVVRQLQAMLVLEGRPSVDEKTSAYCQARARLPEPLLLAALSASAKATDARVPRSETLQDRVVKVMDGTTLTLPDTKKNQQAYPQTASQKPGCGFPVMQLLVVWSARGGGGRARSRQRRPPPRRDAAVAPTQTHAPAAGHCDLRPGRGKLRGLRPIAGQAVRSHQPGCHPQNRLAPGRWLGPGERLVVWKKTKRKPRYLTETEWAALPEEITVRVLRVSVKQKGFRTRELALVTTLLDATTYPAEEITAAYLRRWRLEMGLDDLKTTLGLEALRCQTPAMLHRELLMLFVAHNLVRAVMAEAATAHAAPLEQISFLGTLDTLRNFFRACAQATNATQRRRIWRQMLHAIAADLVPLRPDRWEPRAVKRRPKSYPPLNRPRHLYRDIRHGTRYRRLAK